LLLLHLGHETEAFTREGPDQPLVDPIVTDGGPCRIDAAAEGRFGNDAPLPDSLEHVVPADDAITLANEKFEEVKHLGLHIDNCAPTAQLAPADIKRAITEQINHSKANGDAAALAFKIPRPRVETAPMCGKIDLKDKSSQPHSAEE
jgi:hypothetical protein